VPRRLEHLPSELRGKHGCTQCLPTSARDAVGTASALARIRTLEADSHLRLAISECLECHQHFLAMFAEEVDFDEGDDAQTWSWEPLSPRESAALLHGRTGRSRDAIFRVMAVERLRLTLDHPTGGEAICFWEVPDHVGTEERAADEPATERSAPAETDTLGVHLVAHGRVSEEIAERLTSLQNPPAPTSDDEYHDPGEWYGTSPADAIAFVLCDADTPDSRLSAILDARAVRRRGLLTFGVALHPGSVHFTSAVDMLLRVEAEDAERVVRTMIEMILWHPLICIDLVDLRLLMHERGEAVVERRVGVTQGMLADALRDALASARDRGALTNPDDWLLVMLRHGAQFGVAGMEPLISADPQLLDEERPVMFGTMLDEDCGDTLEIIVLARIHAGSVDVQS
jgi:hypothetical protein